MGNPEGKRSLGRPKCRWEDDMKKDLGVIGWEDMEWIHMNQAGDIMAGSYEGSFSKIFGISRVLELLLASHRGLGSMS
jgi:hypothetical protein